MAYYWKINAAHSVDGKLINEQSCLDNRETFQMFVAVGLRFLQTAHCDKQRFLGHRHLYTIWLFGCYLGKKKGALPLPAPSSEAEDE